MKKLLIGFVTGLFLFPIVVNSYATSVTSAVGVTTNTFGEWSSDFEIGHVSDQSGLSAGFTSGVTDWDTYFLSNPMHRFEAPGYEWWGSETSGFTGSVIFDLGSEYQIDKFAIWNEEVNGISFIDVSTSLDGVLFQPVGVNYTPNDNPLDADYSADIFSMFPTIGRYVRLDIDATGPYELNTASMGEIAFSTDQVAPVPEPATMLLFGTGLAGLAGYRRRQAKKK